MLSCVAFFFGIAITTSFGWLLIIVTEGKQRLLGEAERWCWAAILGSTAFTLIAFITHSLNLVPLTWYGFLIPNAILALLLVIITVKKSLFSISEANVSVVSPELTKKKKILLWILGVFLGAQLLGGSAVLISSPTYHDDAFNNWNMRGKAYFLLKKVDLELPLGNESVQKKEGVSSYPLSLPLTKTWVASLRGVWSEPLINGVNLVFSFGLIFAFFFLARRFLSLFPALLTTYALCSLPLLKIQMFSAYADVMLAAHLLLCMTALSIAANATERNTFTTSIRLFGLILGLTLFTKNEATVMYAPILLGLLIWILLASKRKNLIDTRSLIKIVSGTFAIIILIAAPWFVYKTMHGLTFGNAKAVSELTISFNPLALRAIWFHLSHEANWLFLPLLVPLSILFTGKSAFRLPYGLFTIFVLLAFFEQTAIFTLVPALATEAIKQTGISRGLLHIAPIACLLVAIFVDKSYRKFDEE